MTARQGERAEDGGDDGTTTTMMMAITDDVRRIQSLPSLPVD
jgi:hypothetical protein